MSNTENLWKESIAGVNDTSNKFIAGVIDANEQLVTGVLDTADKYSFANISANFWKIWKGPIGVLGGLGDTDS